MNPARRSFGSKEDLALALAEAVAGHLNEGIERRGAASLAVSGGSTPGKFFGTLGKRRDVAWEKVFVTLVDERWVPETSDRSNAGLVNEEQILAALEYQERLRSKKLGQFLVEKGILQEKDIYLALAEKFRMPFVDLRQQKVSRAVLGLLPREVIQRLHVLPLALRDSSLVVATLMPDPGPLCEVVHRYSKSKNVEFVLVQPSHLKNVIKVLFQPQA